MTSTVSINRYTSRDKTEWDNFISRSKNGVFLFCRDYMDYHADRFTDHSLMFLDADETLLAVMPANIKDEALSSHGGLTFGGIITDSRMKTQLMLELFESLKSYLQSVKIRQLVYKAIPHIYHQLPAEEDLYALYRVGAKLIRRDVSTTIDLDNKLSFSKGRKYEIKQAQKYGLEVKQSIAFDNFMSIEEKVLGSKYDSKPTHTAGELGMLAEKFPEAIKLFVAIRNGEMLAGVVIYESPRVVHAQYIAASDEGKKVGALDLVLNYLISDYCSGKKYFDFGISTVNNGRELNLGLIENKQSFGGRAVVYDFYELEI
jgi:hypothetical protein